MSTETIDRTDGDRRVAEEQIRSLSESKDSGAKYRGLLEAAPDAMVVVSQAGEIVLLNLQAEKQFGYRRDELVGQKVTNIIPSGFAERLIADGARSIRQVNEIDSQPGPRRCNLASDAASPAIIRSSEVERCGESFRR